MLKTRILTALVLVTVFVLAVFGLPHKGWILFCGGILAIAAWEWAALSGMLPIGRAAFASALFGFGVLIAWGWPAIPRFEDIGAYYLIAIAFWALVMPPWLWNGLRTGGKAIVAASGSAVLLPCFFALVHLHSIAPTVLLSYMAIVWIADSAAYFAGKAFGKHKLAPSISPGKTWEGVAGAMAAVTAYGILWIHYFGWGIPTSVREAPLGWVAVLITIWLLSLFSVCGDLFESALKRRAGVKDSGKILPGHGVVLDRIDALIPVLPMAGMLLIL